MVLLLYVHGCVRDADGKGEVTRRQSMVTERGNACRRGITRLNVREGKDDPKSRQCAMGSPSLGGASTFFFFVLLPLGRPLGLFPGWGGGAASGSLVAVASSVTLVGPVGVAPPLIAE